MRVLKNTVRVAAITVAALFICICFVGMFGVWWADHRTTEVLLKGFGLVESAVGVVDAGVERMDELITTSRTEVRQASETITTVGTRPEANGPVLSALNERLEMRLAPRIAQMQQALSPVRDAVGTIASLVSLVSSLPTMAERAPRLAELDETFKRLEGLAADTTQLRSTLRALVAAQTGDLSPETVATLNELTRRIDTRLGEVQTNVQGVQAQIAALHARLDARKSRMLFVFKLMTLLGTLALVWICYTQIVVIRHHRARVGRSAAEPAPSSP